MLCGAIFESCSARVLQVAALEFVGGGFWMIVLHGAPNGNPEDRLWKHGT